MDLIYCLYDRFSPEREVAAVGANRFKQMFPNRIDAQLLECSRSITGQPDFINYVSRQLKLEYRNHWGTSKHGHLEWLVCPLHDCIVCNNIQRLALGEYYFSSVFIAHRDAPGTVFLAEVGSQHKVGCSLTPEKHVKKLGTRKAPSRVVATIDTEYSHQLKNWWLQWFAPWKVGGNFFEMPSECVDEFCAQKGVTVNRI